MRVSAANDAIARVLCEAMPPEQSCYWIDPEMSELCLANVAHVDDSRLYACDLFARFHDGCPAVPSCREVAIAGTAAGGNSPGWEERSVVAISNEEPFLSRFEDDLSSYAPTAAGGPLRVHGLLLCDALVSPSVLHSLLASTRLTFEKFRVVEPLAAEPPSLEESRRWYWGSAVYSFATLELDGRSAPPTQAYKVVPVPGALINGSI